MMKDFLKRYFCSRIVFHKINHTVYNCIGILCLNHMKRTLIGHIITLFGKVHYI